MLPFTPAELADAVIDGRVTVRFHPTLPYSIYNYAPEVQFLNKWDDVTINCRGLILDREFNIIARPWKKFFNLGQVNLPIQFDTPVEVMDKADGSLGILYPLKSKYYSGHHDYAIATRGSFTSEQAIHATELWTNKYDGLHPAPGLTMLFEIIYPKNRIVLNYGDMDDLVLLGAVDKANGYYYSPLVARSMWNTYVNGQLTMIEWPGPVVNVMPYKTISEANAHLERDNAEGYVIRSHNFMVKLKQPDYLDLHRLVTNATPKTVWEKLRDGKSRSEIISAFPDEFHDYIGSMIDPLLEAFDERFSQIQEGFNNVLDSFMSYGDDFNRGGFARYIAKAQDKKYYFLLLDGRPVRDVLWSELKPKEERINA